MSNISLTPEYSSDWFSNNIPKWEKHLGIYRDKPCSYLEIGVHEGRSTDWMFKNILYDKNSKCYCIDIWWSMLYYRRFLNNIIILMDDAELAKLSIIRDSSFNELPRLLQSGRKFDVIYIDGKHHSDAVLMEFGMSWNLLNVGGVIIFDDYLYKEDNQTPIPMKDGIDNILANFTGKYELLDKGYQVFIKKIKS